MMDCGMGEMGGAMALMMGLGFVGTLLVLAVLAGLVFLVVRGILRALHGHRGDPALAELRGAYGRGEVSQEEYEQRRSVLGEGRQ